MPFERPTLTQLIDQGASEFESRLPGVLVRVRRSLVGVINRVLAGAVSALYKYAEYLNLQNWPDRADEEHLTEHGARYGRPRIEAAPAKGTVLVTGTDYSVIPAGAVIQRADGVLYRTDAESVIEDGEAQVNVTAVSAGVNGNLNMGAVLNLSAPIAGVQSSASAQTALSGGADIEGVESWRARILDRIRTVPQGGSINDFIQWTKEVPGVTRPWVFPQEADNHSVTIRFARDGDESPIPDAGAIATVQAHLDSVRPVCTRAYVEALTEKPINFEIGLTPDTPSIRAAVIAELKAFLVREGKPSGELDLSRINEVISIAAGERSHTLIAPAATVVSANDELPVLGTMTWS